MKYIKKYNLIRENLQQNFEIGSHILDLLKSQNDIINDVEDILLEVQDSWGIDVKPFYNLKDTESKDSIEIKTPEVFSYFGMDESDYDDLDSDYQDSINFIENVRKGVYNKLEIDVDYQYPNNSNSFKALDINDDNRGLLEDVSERLRSIGCEVKFEVSKGSNRGYLHMKNLSDFSLLWKIIISIPVSLSVGNKINNLDGLSNEVIKKFNDFVEDYKIDDKGQYILSDIIRLSRKK